jgi:isopenicillin N synthase-like dioxygenase
MHSSHYAVDTILFTEVSYHASFVLLMPLMGYNITMTSSSSSQQQKQRLQRANSAIERERSAANCAPLIINTNDSDNTMDIPIIDLSTKFSEDEIATQLWNAARNVGFFTLINHSIPQNQIDALFTLSSQFFDMDLDIKHRYPFDKVKNSGYEFMTQKPPSTNVVDLKETFQVTAREGCMDNLWPELSSSSSSISSLLLQQEDGGNGDNKQQHKGLFQEVIMEMITSAHALACRVLSLLERRACPHVKRGTLVNAHHLWGEDGQCTLRLLHYPPTTITENVQGEQQEDEEQDTRNDNDTHIIKTTEDDTTNTRWRCGAHTDWGSLTLLFQRMGEDGLECRRRDDEGVEDTCAWVEVPPIEGGITVNIGDMLKRWSDCKLYSNMHRVRMPRSVEECAKSRYSIAFFLQADKSALIENRTNEPITAGDYFAARINAHFSE